MGEAKQLQVRPVSASDANRFVRKHHYSGKVTVNSQLHLGVFLDGPTLLGVMQFGPSTDKRRMLPLVSGTGWNGFLELNRMAFSDVLPKNSESRAMSVAFRIIKKKYPHIEWIVSFADGTQCGDGAIYRAAGFVLTGIKRNTSLLRLPNGAIVARLTLDGNPTQNSSWWRKQGAVPLEGFQLRYVYFLNKEARSRLTAKEIPFSAIAEMGASMYRGKKIERPKQAMAGVQPAQRRGGTDPDAPTSSEVADG